MVLRALFFICMFSALHSSWGMDLNVLFGFLLFPRSWRRLWHDVALIIAVVVLLGVLRFYSEWRYWYLWRCLNLCILGHVISAFFFLKEFHIRQWRLWSILESSPLE